MTVQKTTVQFKNKIYDVILEDGIVSYIDQRRPEHKKSVAQMQGLKITSLESAKNFVLKMIEKRPLPLMTFSD